VPSGPDPTGQPSGTFFVAEDDGWVEILPQSYFAIFVRDPNRPGGLPYWERPANLPAAVLSELAAAVLPQLTPADVALLSVPTRQALADALAPYLPT
jgi:hypothetical protein